MADRINDLTGKEWLQNSFSIRRNLNKTAEEKKLKHPASFPVELAKKVICTWTKKWANILDPFLGSWSTILWALETGRTCTWIDLSKEYCDLSTERIKNQWYNLEKCKIINWDSLEVIPTLNEQFDLILTSPPYRDILNMKRTADRKESHNYSKDKIKDLGNMSDYDLFLESLTKIFSEIRNITKDGWYSVVNVMDIRKKSKFYPLHLDLINNFYNIGWELDDIIIWDRQNEYNNMKTLWYPYKFRINKVHEYLLVFHKS